MFFEVRIFDAKGDLKKVITPKRLSNKFWKHNTNALPDFNDNELPDDEWDISQSINKTTICSDDY
jgi:hypothetical protein